MSAAGETAPGAALLSAEDAAFDRMPIGQGGAGAALAALLLASARGRLAHALLIAGPRGSGKRHVAVRLAQALGCLAGDGRPCLRCAACQRVERGLDPDVRVLGLLFDEKRKQQRSEIGIDQVRDLQERLSFRSAEQRRMVVIDPADRLSAVAQEALLKTIEEPPSGVFLALLTARPSALKATVRSRCQLVRVAPPGREAIVGLLRGEGRSEEEARAAAALSGGDVREALRLDLESAGSEWIGLARGVYEVLGPRGEGRARDLAAAAVPRKSDEDGAGGAREDLPGRWLDVLERILRDVLVAGVAPAGAELTFRLAHPGGEKAARSIATRLPPERAAQALLAIGTAREDLALHVSAKVVLTDLLLLLHGMRLEGAGARSRPGA